MTQDLTDSPIDDAKERETQARNQMANVSRGQAPDVINWGPVITDTLELVDEDKAAKEAERLAKLATQEAQRHAQVDGNSYDALNQTHPGFFVPRRKVLDEGFTNAFVTDRTNDPRRVKNQRSAIYESLEWFWGQNSHDLGQLQRDLYLAGFLDEEPLEWGRYDPDGADAEAWKKVLHLAADTNQNPLNLLNEYATGRVGDKKRAGAGAGSGRRRSDIALMNPDDVKAVVNETARMLTGRRLPDDEIDELIKSFHARQRKEQGAANRVKDSEAGGGTFTEETSAGTVAEELIRQARPVEVRAHSTATAFNEFLGLLGG